MHDGEKLDDLESLHRNLPLDQLEAHLCLSSKSDPGVSRLEQSTPAGHWYGRAFVHLPRPLRLSLKSIIQIM